VPSVPSAYSPILRERNRVGFRRTGLRGGDAGLGVRPLDANRVSTAAEERPVLQVELEPAAECRACVALALVEISALHTHSSERGGARRDLHHLFAVRHAAARSANFA